MTERTTVKWSVFTGVCLGALALAWQGYTYGVALIGVTLLVAMLVERIRKVDSFGLYVSTWIIGLVAFPMCAPYYIVQGEIDLFLEVPILLFFGVLLILLPFLLMRDIPWVFSIPALVAFVGGAALLIKVVFPRYFTDIITGQGYFVKNLIYSTIAEAQAPSVDALVIGYGVFTFFLAFVGLALFGYFLARGRFKRYLIAFMVFAIISVYLPISAAKFFVVGAPAFALLSAEALHRALDVGGYPALRRTVASLSDRGGRATAFRKAFKARHVLVLALVVALILPNVWLSIDAGIPGNTKNAFAQQINDTLPSWLKLNSSAPASNILGAAGTSLDTPNQYDSAAYNWLAQQDTNLPEPQRPAFVSWWDYGFQAIDQGQHPSVADNFQNGIDPAGQFLLAQNESLAIAVLATTLLQGEQEKSGDPNLPTALNAILAKDGVNLTGLHNYLVNESTDYNLVVANPDKYLPVDPSTITDDNAMYLAVSYFLAGSLPLSGVARVYDDLQAYTGWTIRYGMTDSRLFPFSGSDTGIFYAPADLTGRVINSAGLPTTFFNVTVLGSDGNTYPLGQVPADVSPVQYQINYAPPFYDSMIYREYIGYNGTDIGLSGGIPGLSGAAQSAPLEPGWMMEHFQMVYHTAYVCPGIKNATAGASCFHATNQPNALKVANATNGTADTSATSYFEGGETMLAYYPGEPVLGSIHLPNGNPAPGIRVTVYDGSGIPHMTDVTNANGTFSVILPPGNDTLNLTTGTVDALTQAGSDLVRSIKVVVPDALGYSLDPQTVVMSITIPSGTVNGFVYWNTANSSTFEPTTDLVIPGAHVTLSQQGIDSYTAVTDPSGSFSLPAIPPGIYNYSVTTGGVTYNQSNQNVSAGGTTNATVGLSTGSITGNGPDGDRDRGRGRRGEPIEQHRCRVHDHHHHRGSVLLPGFRSRPLYGPGGRVQLLPALERRRGERDHGRVVGVGGPRSRADRYGDGRGGLGRCGRGRRARELRTPPLVHRRGAQRHRSHHQRHEQHDGRHDEPRRLRSDLLAGGELLGLRPRVRGEHALGRPRQRDGRGRRDQPRPAPEPHPGLPPLGRGPGAPRRNALRDRRDRLPELRRRRGGRVGEHHGDVRDVPPERRVLRARAARSEREFHPELRRPRLDHGRQRDHARPRHLELDRPRVHRRDERIGRLLRRRRGGRGDHRRAVRSGCGGSPPPTPRSGSTSPPAFRSRPVATASRRPRPATSRSPAAASRPTACRT